MTVAMLREITTETQCICILLLCYTFYLLPGSGFDFATIGIGPASFIESVVCSSFICNNLDCLWLKFRVSLEILHEAQS